MLKISASALAEIEQAPVQYEREVDESNMTDSTKKTYKLHPNHFVRWLTGDFEPGVRVG